MDVQMSGAEIRNCEDPMRKAETIIREGREANRGDVEAKGRQTLEKAREAKRKNEAIRSNGGLRKKRAEEALRTIPGLLAKAAPAPAPEPTRVRRNSGKGHFQNSCETIKIGPTGFEETEGGSLKYLF